ncbi:UDP-N-acetylmuramoyl-tripeptide--D-alanyl-D-alanine ligase [Cyanobacterium stanieri LEGE 03274]|uniref:UDP-N-acetylmuramoyl-tripeptide--D-alanyl-D-alanine ligase n=1 Tax=Cyanobacterium stanieri LEGE 03274 TaxID=1828756 RepID=A0ABR9V562_9CHRO|nr:UDP-N-acetylmuramoyl-tripeptide--D-alanyl-D-alanine ligase [Cyanobacterium stanieri]MBE9222684.1 UDP-N-acetylmuramoyl-tripeptide--D-alanyl-D-alanine ligase [Cyanobacterium stanieri LEGE 03274]
MNLSLNIAKISEITESVYEAQDGVIIEQPWEGISTDTRSLRRGEIFVALRGENFDGHNFLKEAVTQGAIALIVDENHVSKEAFSVPILRVKDSLEAYQKIAHWWREQLNIPIIGVTGSVGKTTTKELISAILSTQGKVLKTEANYNNEIGVPKTLLSITKEDNFAVIEMAMRGEGEIALLTDIVNPTIGLITNVGTAHIGRLGSREAIARAKCELLGHMNPEGVAILNADNELLMATARTVWQGKTVSYGLENGDFRGEIVDDDKIEVNGEIYPLPLQGRHNALNYLGAIALAHVLELDLEPLKAGIEVNMPKGRAKRYHLDNDIVILDETYNAGFESMLASLELLKNTPGGRKIAVLGTMKELGEYSPALHHQVGEKAAELELDLVLILADEEDTKTIASGAKAIATEIYENHGQLLNRVQQVMTKGDRILFKASNSVGLSAIVEQLI